MKARITYEGIQQVEFSMAPRKAVQENLLNAVMNKDYSFCKPIQISIYKDPMYRGQNIQNGSNKCLMNDNHK